MEYLFANKKDAIKKGKDWISKKRGTLISLSVLLLVSSLLLFFFTFLPNVNNPEYTSGMVFMMLMLVVPALSFGLYFLIYAMARRYDPFEMGCRVYADELNVKIRNANKYKMRFGIKGYDHGKRYIYYSGYNNYFTWKTIYNSLENCEKVEYALSTSEMKELYVSSSKKRKPSPKRKNNNKSNRVWDSELDDDEYQELMEMMDEEN